MKSTSAATPATATATATAARSAGPDGDRRNPVANPQETEYKVVAEREEAIVRGPRRHGREAAHQGHAAGPKTLGTVLARPEIAQGIAPQELLSGSVVPGLPGGTLCELCQAHGTRRVSGSRGVVPDLFVTMCEVRRHASPEDCWIVAKGRVYDVTNYLDDHPGGQRSLVRRGGGARDCEEDHQFHSRHGRSVWERLCIGQVIPCETPPGVIQGSGESCAIL